jgi:hypothetical protein
MIRYSLIIVLSILLGISSYLLYEGRYIVINIEQGSRGTNPSMVQGEEIINDIYAVENEVYLTPKVTVKPDISSEIEILKEDSDIEVHLDPTVGVDINKEQQIASSYRAIGPRQFVLLTKKDEPMVEIDLDTGLVTINPEYKLDEVSEEFWTSIGRKYPEVCFVEEKIQNQDE